MLESTVSFERKPTDFEDALEIIGYGRFHIVLVIVCGVCLFTVNTELYSISYVLPAAECDLDLNSASKGVLTAMSLLGIICSSHLWGYLADTKGRKKMIIVSMLASFVCTVASFYAHQLWLFTVLRFFTGFFISASSAVVFAYLGEFHSVKYRTRSITFASVFIALASVALPLLAWWIIPLNLWRLYIVLCGLPSVIVVLALLPLPESPKFLLLNGKKEEALNIFRNIYAANVKNCAFPIQELVETTKTSFRDTGAFGFDVFFSVWSQTIPLFRSPYLRNILMTCSLQFGIYATSSGLLLWYPDIINRLIDNRNVSICEAFSYRYVNSTCTNDVNSEVFHQNLILGAAYVAGFCVTGYIVNSVGKDQLLIVLLVVSGASGVAVCFVNQPETIKVLFTGFLVLSGICIVVVNAIIIDIFPTHLRAKAMCMSLMFGRIGSVITSLTIGMFLEYDCTATFLVLSGVLFACALLGLFIPKQRGTNNNVYLIASL